MTHNLPPVSFPLTDVAMLHDTTETEVRRVAAEVLNLSPDEPFSFDVLLRINRILGPVPDPHKITRTSTE